MACNFMGTLKLITILFDKKYFATLSAIIVSASTAGTIAAATPLVIMVQFMGWRNSFMTMGGITFFIALLFFFLLGDRPGAKTIMNHQSTSHPKIGDTLKKAKVLFSQKDFWIISFSTFCRYGVFASVQALWAGPYLMKAIGLSPVTAGNIILLMSIGIIIGSPLSGHLSDRIIHSRKKIIIPGIWGMTIILCVFVFLPDGTGKFTLSVLFFLFGLFSSSGQIMYAHIKEQVPHENAGLAMTAINFFTMGGVAVFLQGMGSVMKFLYPGASLGIPAFRSAFLISGICLAIIGVCYTLTSETLSLKIKTPQNAFHKNKDSGIRD
jgi:predicted MFS family arabinose efflux permease